MMDWMRSLRLLFTPPPFHRFNFAARQAVAGAVERAHQVRAPRLELAHLVWAIADLTPRSFEGAVESLRRDLDAASPQPGHGPGSGEVPLSPEVRRAFKRCAELADEMGHAFAGPEHLLLAILLETHNPAAAAARVEIGRMGAQAFAGLDRRSA